MSRIKPALAGLLLLAAAGSQAPARAQDLPLEALVARVQAFYRAADDLRASFVQRKTPRPGMPALEASGTWYVAPPGRLRIEYEDSGRVLVADGESLYWYLPADRQVQVLPQRGEAGTPLLYLGGDGDLLADFQVSGAEWAERLSPANVQIRLEPVGDADQGYSHLVLEVDPATAIVVRLVSFAALGEVSEFLFADVETDVGLDEGLFRFTVPPGTRVEYLGN